VDRAVIATATELFQCGHYPSVLAVCCDALRDEPECAALLEIRARAFIALRRDVDAQADLRRLIRLDPQRSLAYRLLGELAARRHEIESARIFFRETLRLDPGDREAADWLRSVDPLARPAGVARNSPAAAAAVARFPRACPPEPSTTRFARGTLSSASSDDVTKPYHRAPPPFARGSERDGEAWKTPTPAPRPDGGPPNPRRQVAALAKVPVAKVPLATTPPTVVPPTVVPRSIARGSIPELAGFGEYLVSAGILTHERLRAARAYQRSMGVQLSTAIVTLGLATPQRIEWAAVAHQSQLARARQPAS